MLYSSEHQFQLLPCCAPVPEPAPGSYSVISQQKYPFKDEEKMNE
jgi:hypothetical protein